MKIHAQMSWASAWTLTVFVIAWIGGIALAKGWFITLVAIPMFPYAIYLFVVHGLSLVGFLP